jgi:hypothetical protein
VRVVVVVAFEVHVCVFMAGIDFEDDESAIFVFREKFFNSACDVDSGILNALKPQQQRSGGSSGGGVGSPPFNPNASRQQPVTAAQRAASQNAVGRWLDRYRNTGAVSVPDYGYLGEAQGYDLSPWDWLTGYGQEGFDYWQGYYTNADMLGTVSVDYQLSDPYGWTADDYDWFAIDPDSFYY